MDGISTSYLNRMFSDEWVLAEVLDFDVGNRPTRVRVIAHSPNRQDVHPVLMRSRGHLVLLFVTAPNGKCIAF